MTQEAFIDQETLKEMQLRIGKLEKDVIGLISICNRLTDETTKFVTAVEGRFRSQSNNMHSAIRRQSHF